jgi:glycosyltransferase involved in cell wall biosynthesis
VNFSIHPSFFSAGWKSLFDPYLYPQRLKKFIEFQYRQDRPDLVLSFNIFYVVATKRVCPELPVGYLTGGPIADWYSWQYGHFNWVKRHLLRIKTYIAECVEREALTMADKVFAEVQSIQSRLEELHRDIAVRYVLWPTPVDKDRFKPSPSTRMKVRKEMGIDEDQNLLLCVGRLHWNKNFSLTIKALGAIGARNFLLVIVGDGPDRQSLQDLATAVGIGDRVVFLESRGDMERIYAAADVFLHPALVEPYGNVVQEAMSTGLACIVSTGDYIGFSSFLTDEVHALLADPTILRDWTEKLQRLLSDRSLQRRLGASARALIEERPDWSDLTNILLRELDPADGVRRDCTVDN